VGSEGTLGVPHVRGDEGKGRGVGLRREAGGTWGNQDSIKSGRGGGGRGGGGERVRKKSWIAKGKGKG